MHAALGAVVRSAREGVGLSQRELVERTGLSRRTIQNIEAGSHNASLEILLQISHAVGRPLSTLIRDAERGQP